MAQHRKLSTKDHEGAVAFTELFFPCCEFLIMIENKASMNCVALGVDITHTNEKSLRTAPLKWPVKHPEISQQRVGGGLVVGWWWVGGGGWWQGRCLTIDGTYHSKFTNIHTNLANFEIFRSKGHKSANSAKGRDGTGREGTGRDRTGGSGTGGDRRQMPCERWIIHDCQSSKGVLVVTSTTILSYHTSLARSAIQDNVTFKVTFI